MKIKEAFKDINGKESQSRKFLAKYSPLVLFITLTICLYSVISKHEIPDGTVELLIWLNGMVMGFPFMKMGAESLGKKNVK